MCITQGIELRLQVKVFHLYSHLPSHFCFGEIISSQKHYQYVTILKYNTIEQLLNTTLLFCKCLTLEHSHFHMMLAATKKELNLLIDQKIRSNLER